MLLKDITNTKRLKKSLVQLHSLHDKLDIKQFYPYTQTILQHYKTAEPEYEEYLTENEAKIFNINDLNNNFLNNGNTDKVSELLDWVNTTNSKLGFTQETLFLSYNIINRVLFLKSLSDSKLNLLGVSAILLASKYEEVMPASIETFSNLSRFGEEDILRAEKYILSILDFKLDYPSPLNFMRYVWKADNYCERVMNIGMYLLETCFVYGLKVRSSLLGIGCMCVGRKICGKGDVVFWEFSLYDKREVEKVCLMIGEIIKMNLMYENIDRKYRGVGEKIRKYFSNI